MDDFVFDVGVGELGSCILYVRNVLLFVVIFFLVIVKMVVDKVENIFYL